MSWFKNIGKVGLTALFPASYLALWGTELSEVREGQEEVLKKDIGKLILPLIILGVVLYFVFKK